MSKAPRIPPLRPEEWTAEQRKLLGGAWAKGGFYNLLGTFSRHLEASRRIGQLSAHVLGPTSTLAPRDRELLILRTAWNCRAEYEWAQHVRLAGRAGIGPGEIARCRLGPGAPGWSEREAALLQAADELHSVQCIGDSTWQLLARYYAPAQLMDIVVAVGHYTLIAMALKSFGTPLDEGLQGF